VKRPRGARRALALLLFVPWACGAPPSQPWRPPAEHSARWPTTLEAWTRRGEAYEAFEGRLFVTATCLSPALASGLLRERAQREGWPGERLESALADQARQDAARLTFLVGVTAQDARWDDAAPGGTLEMHVRLDGQPAGAATVVKLADDAIGDLVPYYPWITPLHSVYRIEVPARDAPARVDLAVAGPPARVELAWEVAP
jgi:hypothetical protein